MIVDGVSQQLQFNYYCGLFIASFIYAYRDFNFRLRLCTVIKFRAKLKTAQLANFFSYVATCHCLSRHK